MDFCTASSRSLDGSFPKTLVDAIPNLFASTMSISTTSRTRDHERGQQQPQRKVSSCVRLASEHRLISPQFFSMGTALIAFCAVRIRHVARHKFARAIGPARRGATRRSEWCSGDLPGDWLSPFAAVFYPLAVVPHWMKGFGPLRCRLRCVRGENAQLAGGGRSGICGCRIAGGRG